MPVRQSPDHRSLPRLLATARLADRPGSPGERDAAIAAVARLLEVQGLSWEALLSQAMLLPGPQPPPPYSRTQPERRAPSRSPEPWRETVAACLHHDDALTAWEAMFLSGLSRFPTLSSRQLAKLNQIADRVLGRR